MVLIAIAAGLFSLPLCPGPGLALLLEHLVLLFDLPSTALGVATTACGQQHVDLAAVQQAVMVGQGFLDGIRVGQLQETVALAQADGTDGAARFEKGPELWLGGSMRDVADEQDEPRLGLPRDRSRHRFCHGGYSRLVKNYPF